MNNSQEDVYTLVADAYFCRWVKHPDEETSAFWEQWLTEHPEKRETLDQARRIVAFLTFRVEDPRPEEQQEVKMRVMRQLHSNSRVYRDAHRRYLLVAAVVTGLLLLGGYLGQWFARGTPYQEYRTTFGEQQEVILPDGTQVTLNANSQLKFEKDWSANPTRDVWLQGEAFFEVTKQSEASGARFIVRTHQLEVEALGTSFNVCARDLKTQVVLNTGKVKLHRAHPCAGEPDLFLEPGDMATLSGDRLVKSQVNPQHYSSWQDNRLFFNNETIRDIALRLKETYGYQVIVEQPAWLDLRFTGSCPADDITILLTALAESFRLEVIRTNNTIRLQSPTSP